jgi:hypothetical protein
MRTSIQLARRLGATVLILAIACGANSGWAQDAQTSAASQPNPQTGQQTAQPSKLFITIIEGEGALNDIRARTAREPIVEVNDENHKPVAGALILFALDNGGGGSPFATFTGAQSLTVTTDAAGRATARGFAPTHRAGQYRIKVHASKGPATADGVITMVNVAAGSSGGNSTIPTAIISHKKLEWIVGGAAAVGVIIGVVIVETRGSSPITVGNGGGTVGPPSVRPGIRIQFHRKEH